LALAYPDGHPDHETDEDGEIDYLKAKIDAGADFIVTQLFYDVDGFFRWMKKVRGRGLALLVYTLGQSWLTQFF
jgi:methylenetetrahydrofolate reductase (NADPH)